MVHGGRWSRPVGVRVPVSVPARRRSEEHTSELQSPCNLVCRLLLEKKKKTLVRPGVPDDGHLPRGDLRRPTLVLVRVVAARRAPTVLCIAGSGCRDRPVTCRGFTLLS